MQIKSPTLLINKSILEANLLRMKNKADEHLLELRPHMKTAQLVAVADIARELGIKKITVSSLSMAQYFADAGYQDICIAFPLNILETEEILDLSKKIKLSLIIDQVQTAEFLAAKITEKLNLWIEINTAAHRSGISFQNTALISQILGILKSNPNICFSGFLTHAGHTYAAKDATEILQLHKQEIEIFSALKKTFSDYSPKISIGDTPSATLSDNFEGIDEIRPGNFMYYDLMQEAQGVCSLENIASALAVPVVSVYNERREALVYGGAVHLSKEYILHNQKKIFGKLYKLNKNKQWDTTNEIGYVKSISQEHGIIALNPGKEIKQGGILAVLPVHSCLTANLMSGINCKEKKYIFV
jgi:D-serine deaminase-like pyridoxal phosphate-dependent protein